MMYPRVVFRGDGEETDWDDTAAHEQGNDGQDSGDSSNQGTGGDSGGNE